MTDFLHHAGQAYPREKTLFFDIYFTFLFIQTFVSHFPYVTFFFKAVVIFFVFMSRRLTQSMGSIRLVYLKKNLFLV